MLKWSLPHRFRLSSLPQTVYCRHGKLLCLLVVVSKWNCNFHIGTNADLPVGTANIFQFHPPFSQECDIFFGSRFWELTRLKRQSSSPLFLPSKLAAVINYLHLG